MARYGAMIDPAVHTHVRGDNDGPIWCHDRSRGSHPRAWGQRYPLIFCKNCNRFTPTCVGTTTHGSQENPCPTVHPHVRGDNQHRPSLERGAAGSPPRAWGQLYDHDNHRRVARFTPTCVGTTADRRFKPSILPVHPHVRGDNGIEPNAFRYNCGSPPRAWGQLPAVLSDSIFGRFTPTCVGTTSRAAFS